jgi:hypothetical protein
MKKEVPSLKFSKIAVFVKQSELQLLHQISHEEESMAIWFGQF